MEMFAFIHQPNSVFIWISFANTVCMLLWPIKSGKLHFFYRFNRLFSHLFSFDACDRVGGGLTWFGVYERTLFFRTTENAQTNRFKWLSNLFLSEILADRWPTPCTQTYSIIFSENDFVEQLTFKQFKWKPQKLPAISVWFDLTWNRQTLVQNTLKSFSWWHLFSWWQFQRNPSKISLFCHSYSIKKRKQNGMNQSEYVLCHLINLHAHSVCIS